MMLILAALRLTIVVALVLIAERLLRRSSARYRHLLLVITIAGALLPPLIPAPSFVATARLAPPAARTGAAPLFAAIYAAGLLLGVARLLMEMRRLKAMRGRGRRAPREVLALAGNASTGILLTADDAGPMVLGVRDPVILISEQTLRELAHDELRVVIAHELAHVRRRDVLAAYVSRAALLVWWFNPLIWMLAAAERRVREEACDEDVVRNAAVAPASYCETLVRAAAVSAGHAPALTTAFAGEHPLQRRIRRVMTIDRAARPRGRTTVVLLASIVIAAQLLASPRPALPVSPRITNDGPTAEGERLMEAAIEMFSGDSPSPSPSPSP